MLGSSDGASNQRLTHFFHSLAQILDLLGLTLDKKERKKKIRKGKGENEKEKKVTEKLQLQGKQ